MSDREYAISVDRTSCAGSGVCVVFAPRTFDMDDDAKSFVLDPTGDPFEQVEAAVAGCPMRAIALTQAADSASGEDGSHPIRTSF